MSFDKVFDRMTSIVDWVPPKLLDENCVYRIVNGNLYSFYSEQARPRLDSGQVLHLVTYVTDVFRIYFRATNKFTNLPSSSTMPPCFYPALEKIELALAHLSPMEVLQAPTTGGLPDIKSDEFLTVSNLLQNIVSMIPEEYKQFEGTEFIQTFVEENTNMWSKCARAFLRNIHTRVTDIQYLRHQQSLENMETESQMPYKWSLYINSWISHHQKNSRVCVNFMSYPTIRNAKPRIEYPEETVNGDDGLIARNRKNFIAYQIDLLKSLKEQNEDSNVSQINDQKKCITKLLNNINTIRDLRKPAAAFDETLINSTLVLAKRYIFNINRCCISPETKYKTKILQLWLDHLQEVYVMVKCISPAELLLAAEKDDRIQVSNKELYTVTKIVTDEVTRIGSVYDSILIPFTDRTIFTNILIEQQKRKRLGVHEVVSQSVFDCEMSFQLDCRVPVIGNKIKLGAGDYWHVSNSKPMPMGWFLHIEHEGAEACPESSRFNSQRVPAASFAIVRLRRWIARKRNKSSVSSLNYLLWERIHFSQCSNWSELNGMILNYCFNTFFFCTNFVSRVY